MDHIFVNFTNHPSYQWTDVQKKEAMKYGRIVDITFPKVDPAGNQEYIIHLAQDCVRKIMESHPTAVLCQGEFCLAYRVISELKKEGICVLAACSERIVTEKKNVKKVTFVFEQFREY